MNYRLLSKYRSELMGFAMLWVMLFHASDLDLMLPALNLVRAAGFGGVDIFILLSAMGISMSLAEKEQDYSAFMARRGMRILPAYYAVVLPYTLFLIFRGSANWSALFFNSSLLYYWVGSEGSFNWYVAGIMTFYAVTPLCVRLLKRTKRPTLFTTAAVFLSLILCQILIWNDWWRITDIFYRVPVFFIGLLLGKWVKEEKKLTSAHLLFWLAALCAGALYLSISSKFWFFPLCHLFLFTTVPLCLILCLIFDKLPINPLWKFLRLVGEHSLEIYLLNVSFFSLTNLFRGMFQISCVPLYWFFLLRA